MPLITRNVSRWRRAFGVALAATALIAVVWFARHSILAGAGALLVVEDPLTRAEIMVVSNSMPRATAFEAAALYQQQVSPRIVMADWVDDPLADKIRALGIPYLTPAELSTMVMERSGVPSAAITILKDRVDGTGSEVAAIAAFVEQHQLTSVLIVTARSHTARTKWLLQRKLSKRTRVTVRSARFDRFPVGAWWRDREYTREVLTEYLRWFNTMYLPEMWSHQIDSGRVGLSAR